MTTRRSGRRFGFSAFAKYVGLFAGFAVIMCLELLPGYLQVIFTIDRWKTATAVVESTEVDYSFFRSLFDRNQRYTPLVHYTFEIDGKTYKGDHITYPSGERYNRDAQDDIKPYRAGDKIQVFYDPASPDATAIEKPSYIWLYLWIAGTLGIIVFTISSVLLRQWKRDKADAA